VNRIAMSPAASSLLRALIARAGVPADRILLTEVRSIDWQSLTFIGERHEFGLRIIGPGASAIAERLWTGLDDAEFQIPRRIVADIAMAGQPALGRDGSVSIAIEALTVEE